MATARHILFSLAVVLTLAAAASVSPLPITHGSAHPSAADQLLRVVREIGASSPGVALAAVHRVGELQVGDIAVIVAAGAPHRDEAFRIGRLLIDRIKAEVPLWKRQHFADGAQEWVGACD